MNVCLAIALTVVAAATKPSDPPKYAWDLSKSLSIEQVAWPRNQRAALDLFYDVTANGVVRIVLPEGRVIEDRVERASFCRDGKRITSITLDFDEQTIDEVYATATELAKTWAIPTPKLVAWKNVVKDEWSNGVMIMRPDVDPSPAIEIVKTYDPKKPFHILFKIGWDIRPLLANPTTRPVPKSVPQPSTRPAPASPTSGTRKSPSAS